jgi:hypothetical protein
MATKDWRWGLTNVQEVTEQYAKGDVKGLDEERSWTLNSEG